MYCITINLKGTFISCSCTCVSSDDSHCFIANRNQGNTPGKFILTSIRSATVCALLLIYQIIISPIPSIPDLFTPISLNKII